MDKEMLLECFTDVLEKMAFMFVEIADVDEMPDDCDNHLLSSMSYKGAAEGKIEILFPKDLTIELSANVLGIEEDDENIDQIAYDTLKELLNVACGNILTAHYGIDPVFDLTVPEVNPLPVADWVKYLNDEGNLLLLVDDSPVIISFKPKE